jgi:hypothetical protein
MAVQVRLVGEPDEVARALDALGGVLALTEVSPPSSTGSKSRWGHSTERCMIF